MPGVGLELTEILFQKKASVYIAGRSESEAETAITNIKADCPSSRGKLKFL